MTLRWFTKLLAMVGAAALLFSGLMIVAVSPAGALTVDVTTTTDGGPGSLRQAINDINAAGVGPHTINLAAGQTYPIDQCGAADSGGLLINNGPLTINGNGSTVAMTCAGARVFRYNNTSQLTINDLTVTGGNRSGRGAGLKSFGPVSINNSAFIGNTASGEGGGIWAESQDIIVNQSTFAGNDANRGGAIYSVEGEVTVLNSTITGNSAEVGGAIFAVDQTYVFATVVGNDATETGAAIIAEAVRSFGSVFAQNDSPSFPCEGSVTSDGYNWTDDERCDFGGATDVLDEGGDPLLGPLGDNGGPTPTRLPETGSPLVDAIPATVVDCDGDDQRGVSRPQGGACEIGAVEIAGEDPLVPTTPPTTPTTTAIGTRPTIVTPRFAG
jgi:hypothetical protein